ncbi:MAG: hypothetical protein AAFQ64_10420 [Pseudomonadota bacterium]
MTFSFHDDQFDPKKNATALNNTMFRLGMPHVDAKGFSNAWLMNEAAQMHLEAVAEELGQPPARWVDSAGRRFFASVAVATLSGSSVAFREDTACCLRMVVRPSARTRWLSQIDLESPSGKRICVEIVTTFVTLDGRFRVKLAKAGSNGQADAGVTDPDDRRSQTLLDLGKVELKRAATCEGLAQISFPISKTEHLNDLGLVDFAHFQTFFAEAEATVCAAPAQGLCLVTRRVHYFDHLVADDGLDIVTTLTTNVHNLPSWMIAFSVARRQSDGKVVAACESSYRV